jgi:hypothetical protein
MIKPFLLLVSLPDAVKNAVVGLTLSSLWSIAALAFALAGLSHFLQLTFDKGMIFRKYRSFIGRYFWYKPRPRRTPPMYARGAWNRALADVRKNYYGDPTPDFERLKEFGIQVSQIAKLRYRVEFRGDYDVIDHPRLYGLLTRLQPLRSTIIPARWYRWFFKPLGGCIYCNAPYLSLPFYCLFVAGDVIPVSALGAVLIWPLFIGLNYIGIVTIEKISK